MHKISSIFVMASSTSHHHLTLAQMVEWRTIMGNLDIVILRSLVRLELLFCFYYGIFLVVLVFCMRVIIPYRRNIGTIAIDN
jgi:hypothetical protein